MFKKILVANRGEIARRIFLACQELGLSSVAIYSEADAGAPWTWLADERYPLAGVSATETYLNQAAVFNIAAACGADAIHPGYGFLSENADFAEACAERGLTFIGPTPEAMRAMGDKAAARALAEQAGVPVVPGVDGAGLTDAALQESADAMGYPVLIKASAGGGGKGMRVVAAPADFADALQAARKEAQSAFGDDHVIVEKYFTEIHHVEIQVLGDQQGKVLHLFERECSVQRRHQKIIEESPSPIVNDELRQRMAAAAVTLAQAVNYVSAGTVEFIVDRTIACNTIARNAIAHNAIAHNGGKFYFLEMNTRLQVEHPVTELVTGLDLAVWQIRIAMGEALPLAQSDLQQHGHALECRVYAEDPANHFLPSIGEITWYERPSGPGVRVDDALSSRALTSGALEPGSFETGMQVTPYYDPMLAKVITWGRNRAEAVAKMRRALRDTAVLGVTTNIPYLLAILDEPHFVAGNVSTNYLAEHMADWQADGKVADKDWLAVAAVEMLLATRGKGGTADIEQLSRQPDPWNGTTGWRNVMNE